MMGCLFVMQENVAHQHHAAIFDTRWFAAILNKTTTSIINGGLACGWFALFSLSGVSVVVMSWGFLCSKIMLYQVVDKVLSTYFLNTTLHSRPLWEKTVQPQPNVCCFMHY